VGIIDRHLLVIGPHPRV